MRKKFQNERKKKVIKKEAKKNMADDQKRPDSSDDDDDDDDDDIERLQYKVVILGDGAVGKTSITSRFVDDHFAKSYKQTIGVDWFIKRVVLPGDVHVALQIWDIGGQQVGSNMISSYIYGAQAVMLCYDITNYQSFQNLEDWHAIVKKTFGKEPLPYIALVGNKSDQVHLQAVSKEKAQTFSDEGDMYNNSMSAKTGDRVHSTFYHIAADLAGIVLTKNELNASARVLQADIVNHPQHDPGATERPDINRSDSGGCSVS